MSCCRTCSPAVLAWALVLITGCGGGDSRERAPARGAPVAGSDGLDRCALLREDEISQAIGAHGPGTSDLSNAWGTQSCRWTATKAQPMEGNPEGWHDAIEVAVFDAPMTPMVRQQVRGDPVAGALPGATYDASFGDLWFDCPGGRLCAVKARTFSGDQRRQIATQLARLVRSRLH
jgi:hypothetical protein